MLKKIPDLTSAQLDRYDSLIALLSEFIHDQAGVRLTPPPGGGVPLEIPPPRVRHELLAVKPRQTTLDDGVRIVSDEAYSLLAPYRVRFEALHDLWIARHRLANQQGSLLQLPTSPARLKNWVTAAVNYEWVNIRTSIVLFDEQIGGSLDNIPCPEQLKKILRVAVWVLATLLVCGSGYVVYTRFLIGKG